MNIPTPRTDLMVTGNSDPSRDEYEDLAQWARQLERALTAALPILEEHAEDERSFWGEEDKHGIAREAEQVYERAKEVLYS